MKTSDKIWHWLPRIICLAAILFISLFAADSFTPGLTIWQQLGNFVMHLIPSFILLSILIVAWKREFIGGLLFIFIGLVFSPIVFFHNYNMNHSIWMSLGIIMAITFPLLMVGILFIISHNKKKLKSHKTAE